MSKKLKKRIRELCSLDTLSKEDRISRCYELLKDNEAKQTMCNAVPGLTFKDIDKALKAEINSRRPPTEEEIIFKELEEENPEKLDPELPLIRKRKVLKLGYYSKNETLDLVNAEEVGSGEQPKSKVEFTTYSPEETADIISK